MNDTEINNMIRRLAIEERQRQISPEIITQVKTDAINVLAQLLVSASPEYFEKKVSLAPKNTNTHQFTLPSDCLGLKRVWDYDGDAAEVSATADNGSGAVRITTAAAHGRSDEDIVTIHDIVGTTEANGTFQIDYVSTTQFDLVGTTYANAYTSGGRVFVESEDTYKYPIERRPAKYQTGADETTYFLNQDDIVVDDPGFENDLIILYRYLPTTLAEIPTRMHSGIYAFGVIMLVHLDPKEPMYAQRKKNYDLCSGLWESAQAMASQFKPVLGANNISKSAPNRWL